MFADSEKNVLLLLKALLFTFVIVSPYANKINPPLLVMALLLVLLAIPAAVVMLRAERKVFEVWLFLPLLGISIAVGLLNGHIPANVVRGSIPYLIYIVAFASILYIPPEKRFELMRWYVYMAVLVSLKTFAILIYNGVTPSDIARGARATFYDINSGFPIAMAAVPFVFVFFKNRWLQAILLLILVGQVTLGQSKILMLATVVILAVFFMIFTPNQKLIGVRATVLLTKFLTVIGIIGIIIFTFNDNPLLQRFSRMVTNPNIELSGRVYEMGNAIRSIDKNPFLGRGQGYVFIHKSANSPDNAPRFEERRYVHSVLFYHLAIMGLIGLPFALLMFHGPAFYFLVLAKKGRAGAGDQAKKNKYTGNLDQFYLPIKMAAFGLFAFYMVSAAFKNPQSLILLALVNALIYTLLEHQKSSVPTVSGKITEADPA